MLKLFFTYINIVLFDLPYICKAITEIYGVYTYAYFLEHHAKYDCKARKIILIFVFTIFKTEHFGLPYFANIYLFINTHFVDWILYSHDQKMMPNPVLNQPNT